MPDRRYTALAAGSAVGAVLALLLTPDPAGRLLFALAAALLLGYVITDLVFSPRLEATADGLVVRVPWSRKDLSWAEVEAVRAETRFRRGLRSTTLEIDAGPTLVVLSRRALGAAPAEVAALVEAFRPPPRSGR